MGTTSGVLLSLTVFILFSSVSCRPQKQQNIAKHHKAVHTHHNATVSKSTHHFAVNPTAIHLYKPSAVAIYDNDNTTVIRPLDENDYCPRDAMRMHCCVDLFGDIMNIVAGKPGKHPCCSALFGLIDLEAAMCLCTTIKANIFGFTIDMPIKMTLLLNYCNKPVPKGFMCK